MNNIDNTRDHLFDDYVLYHPEIEAFFLENYLYRQDLECGTIYSRSSYGKNWGKDSVLYIHQGYFKIYLTNSAGNESFTGFMPQYSVLYSARTGAPHMGKYMVANASVTIYVTTQKDYLAFLQSSPELISHQLEEPYYRRNINDVPRYIGMNASSRYKVWEFILYVALRFGFREDTALVMKIHPPIPISHAFSIFIPTT